MDNELKSNEQKQKKAKKTVGKYYVLESKGLASTLEWITGQKPYMFNDRRKEGCFVYSFLYDDTFKEALTSLHILRNKLRKEY